MPTGLVYVSRMKEIRTKKKRGSRSFFTNVHMESLTRVLIQVVDHNNSDEFIQSFAAPANDLEIHMLEAINGKSEGECEDTPDELSHLCVMHFLGKAAYYRNKEGFEAWLNGDPAEGYPGECAPQGAKALLTWANHGKWSECKLSGSYCLGVVRFYHLHLYL